MPKIDRLYAYVIAEAGPDDEGVPAVMSPTWGSMPLMGADVERAKSLEATAQSVADLHGKPVELRVFTTMSVVRTLWPKGGKGTV